MRRPLLPTLVLTLLALFFAWETRQALREPAGGPDNTAAAEAGLWRPGAPVPDPAPSPDPGPSAAAVAARPLFRPDRQPFREQAVAVSAARNYESELSRFTLLGVFGFGGEPVGVVTGKSGSKTDRWELKAGDALPGFTVKEVGVEGLRLAADGREFLLPLYAGAPTVSGAAVRTEAIRRDAAQPSAAPGAPVAASPAAPVARPAPAAPSAPAPAAQPRTPAPYTPPYRTPPGVSPRFVPGRR